jgi:hypothetical protein
VEKASFTGIYGIKEAGCFPELHTDGFSGFCYAWRQENGINIVLPMGRGNTPHGSCYLVDDRDFTFLFSPVDSAITPDDFILRPPLRSDAPDLLGMWYEQSLAGQPSAPVSPATGHENGSLFLSSLSGDETLLTPAWHPDDIFHEPEDKAVPDTGYVSEPPVANQTAPSESGPPEADDAASAPVAKVSVEEEQEDPESRSARLEQRMRGKFEFLLQAMDDNADPQAEEEVARLLTLGSSFGWKQKFMFTEFGLALRRKRKFTLALSSHLRALDLAPNDEHILFNVARAEYELRNPDNARYYLDKALSVAPDFTVAKNFQSFLLGRT